MDQTIGYILTGGPTYIINNSGARQLAAGFDRYELLEDLLRAYRPRMQQLSTLHETELLCKCREWRASQLSF